MTESQHLVLPDRLADRRGLLRGAVAGGLAGFAMVAPTRSGKRAALAQQATPVVVASQEATPVAVGGQAEAEVEGANPYFADEAAVLNFALTLEHLDSTLYRTGLEQFAAEDFVAVGYDASVRDYLEQIAANEEAQVAFLSDTIASLGGEPVGPAEYSFPYATLGEWLVLSQQVEEVGLDAYTGVAQYLIGNDDLLTAALAIHAVEARHLAYFRLINGVVPFPDSVEAPLTPPEVVALASPFVVGGIPEPSAG